MNNWNIYRIKDICEIKSGKRLPKGCDFSSTQTQYPYIRARDIKNGKINTNDLAYISQDVQSKIKRYIVNENDIAITIVANIGDVGFVSKELDGFNLTENAVRLTNFHKNVNSKYLCYYLSQPNLKTYMEGFAVGAAQAKLGIYKIEKLKVQLPPLPSQQKIASILSGYDNLIQNYKKQIEALQTAASELYKEWFVRFRFSGWQNAKFENGIPEGWDYIQLKDIIKFDRGISYSSDEIDCDDGVNLINLKNIEVYGGFRRDGTKKYNGKYKPEQMVKCGDLVMGITDMTQDRRTVGSVALIPNIEGICVISADLLKVTTKISKIFFYSLCRFGQYSRYFSMFANGANVLHLRPDSLLRKKILLPTNALIEQFDSVVSSIINKMDKLNLAIDNLTQQRDLLLPRLMSGKLEVE